MESSAAASFRISAWTGEFVDSRVEAEYQRRRCAVTARHAIIAINIAALAFFVFCFTDWLAFGWSAATRWLWAMRGGVLVAGLAAALWIQLSPLAAGRGTVATLFEIAALLAFLVVVTMRAEAGVLSGMSMMVMLTAIYLLIPNRPVYMLLIGAFATTGFALLFAGRLIGSLSDLVDVLTLLFLVNAFGFLAALRLSIVRREEFRLLARAEQANTRLTGEIERRRHLERELTRLATTDSLTGLYNRRQYLELSGQELQRAARSRQPVAVLLLDIDFFKRVNDRFGHAVGDDALRAVTRALRYELRGTDIIARFGGEEFAVTLPDAPVKRAQAVAERIRAAIAEQRIPGAPPEFHLTATLGVAVHEARGESVEALISRADRALYEGKSAGRDRVVTLGPVVVSHRG